MNSLYIESGVNYKIYLAVFYSEDQTKVKIIYELEPEAVEKETIRQLDRSSNDISHVGFSLKWARENGSLVYLDDQNT